MKERTKPLAWMWGVDGEVYGLSIDAETEKLRWFANAGCLCDWDDSEVDQTPVQFLERGVPGRIAEPDIETLREIRRAVAALAHPRGSVENWQGSWLTVQQTATTQGEEAAVASARPQPPR